MSIAQTLKTTHRNHYTLLAAAEKLAITNQLDAENVTIFAFEDGSELHFLPASLTTVRHVVEVVA